jgi:Protein of unknown function (DUF2892)
MSIERWIRLIAGSLIMMSVALTYLHSSYWLFFTLLLGASLVQSAWTRWCPMEDVLRRFSVRHVGGH